MLPYEKATGEVWETTVDTKNRIADRNRIEIQYGLNECGSYVQKIFSPNGTPLAVGYCRMVYGDHGPYIEFMPGNIIRESWRCIRRRVGWYDKCVPTDGSDVLLYVQRKTVKNLPNPPKGKWSMNNNRAEGYADYRVGRLYISPDQIKL